MYNETIALGIMSGTSLDGLDLALCRFYKEQEQWRFKILKAATVPYCPTWKSKLFTAQLLSALEFALLNNEFGAFIGEQINVFLKDCAVKPQLIASHGHTVFHQPNRKLSVQIGSGAEIAAKTGITTVFDFRALDAALEGQGAPLVPMGDELLFPEYDICLNLGGFANYSVHYGERIARDAGAFNFVLNALSRELGLDFDFAGSIGRAGNVDPNLLTKLNQMSIYDQKGPKSLAREWVETELFPLINAFDIETEDKLATYYEHFSFQLSKELKTFNKSSLLLSGGGAYNKWFVDLLQQKSGLKIILPPKEIIEYKEALIFAFLGTLRLQNSINTLKSVTGATKNSSGGSVVVY